MTDSDWNKLFSNTQDPACWMKHAKGLSQLAEFRGLDRYRTEFDSILLKASRGIIVCSLWPGLLASMLTRADHAFFIFWPGMLPSIGGLAFGYEGAL